MKRIREYALVGLMLSLLLMLVACSSQSKLSDVDIEGTWVVTESNSVSNSELNDKGMYTFYRFNDDHSINMIALIQGSEYNVRNGSWRIDDNRVHFDVDATGEGPTKAEAITDGVMDVSDSLLETDSIGGGHVEAKKISDDEVSKIYEQSKSFGPKQVSLGEQVSGNGYTFTLTSFDFKDEIYPSDTSSYYRYYQDESGKTYLCVRAKLTNDSSDYVGFCRATSAEFNVGGNKYSASIEQDINRGFWSMYTLDAKDTGSYIIYASIPDSVKDSNDITLTWSFPQSASRLQSYFSSSSDNVSYCLKK